MGKLQVLPAQLANMIAAGEVVGRPASVVKELVENAVDAGATQITVVVGDSGRTLIQVIDNGCGMSPEDAMLCFERHATSKIASPEDLTRILTFGFRGEALASIAAVSEITLKSRREEDAVATQVVVGAFGAREQSECSAPKGTSIAVRNLFYNTPARRKFLKSDNVELKHIIEEFTHVALTRPEIAFTLTHNGRDIYAVKKAKSLKFRILDLLGQGVVGDIVDLETKTSIVSLSGFIGRPEGAKKALGNQFLFVNGRYFRSPYFHKAIMNAYAEMTPEGLTPSYFLFLEVDPESIDVNISPTKTEIKFEEDNVIFQTIFAAVRETLGRNSFGASIDFETEGAVELPQLGSSFAAYKPADIAPSHEFDPFYNPFNQAAPTTVGGSFSADFQKGYQPVHKTENYGVLFEQANLPSRQALVIQGKFILTPSQDGLLIVNIRRAQTRILYERMLRALKGETAVSQATMFPVQIQVGAAQMPLVEENMDLLSSLGFEITPFGPDTITVSGIPSGYESDEMSVGGVVADLLQILQDETHSLPEVMQTSTAQRLAESGASRFSTIRSTTEAVALLDELFRCTNTELTPSGKRISYIASVGEIERKF